MIFIDFLVVAALQKPSNRRKTFPKGLTSMIWWNTPPRLLEAETFVSQLCYLKEKTLTNGLLLIVSYKSWIICLFFIFKTLTMFIPNEIWYVASLAFLVVYCFHVRVCVSHYRVTNRPSFTLNSAVDFFNQINMLYGTITEFCTVESCAVMSAGPKWVHTY